MSYSSRFFVEYLLDSRVTEEKNLPKGRFSARYSKVLRRSSVVLTVLVGTTGVLQILAGSEPGVPELFLGLAGLMLLMLPTVLSYRCEVDEGSLRESYLILFIPRRKEVLWRDIHFKKVRRDKLGRPLRIKLYNKKGKKLLTIDSDVVGLGPIARMAKGIPNRK